MRPGGFVQYTPMSAGAASISSRDEILCESCGYTLIGLPEVGNCPECGSPVAESTFASGRTLPLWESERRFWATTIAVVGRTSHFYRTLMTRVESHQHRAAYGFAFRHWLIAGVLVALVSALHYTLTDVAPAPALLGQLMLMSIWIAVVTALFIFAAMAVTHTATWLTAWEAGWRGYRLPREVVLRGLCYHSAHLLPVAIVALATVLSYRALLMLGVVELDTIVIYLGALSAITIAGALYLFWTYWLAMKNMLYANQ